jgi:predicted CoA-binding protein
MDENAQILNVLKNSSVIAVVGLSRNPSKDSFKVANYLKRNGYRIIPVNPFAEEILGEKSYPDLLNLPEQIKSKTEIIAVFRPSNEILPIVEQAIELKRKWGMPLVFWMQLEIINTEAAEIARRAGILVVMDKCIMREHIKLRRNR